MEAPKCRLCGERHWASCAVTTPAPKLKAMMSKPIAKPVSLTASPRPVSPTVAHKPKFDRNAYQRDLTRERRAQAKKKT
jgi:hypothetical protein